MKCAKCNTESPEANMFCRERGGKLIIVYLECGSECPPGDGFCGNCGHNLSAGTQTPPEPSPRERSLDDKLVTMKYLPTGLAEKVLASRGRIEGERRQVLVTCTDTKEFTPLTEKLDPEKTYELTDQAFDLPIHKVYDYEGTANELRGDGVLALFGASIALEDAPQQDAML